ncbi:MAG: cysteine--tRNA ligase [Thermonemataceae bacterium]|nr:cysteine--tRNA ligase [Thermonemataceae bacterium]
MAKLSIYNTLSRKKEVFEAINPPFVGIYLCGPTVYNDAHLGNGRPAVIFDVLRRYLQYLGYKVRFVRNITDVGHLLGDTNEGEDRISKQAKLERLEPMEIVQRYTIHYHQVMDKLGVLRPDVEPTATGHIVEQIEITKKILEEGLAYEINGSVYFDVNAYQQKYTYGELSGRVIEELIAGAGEERRSLEGQEEKRNPADFALWKKAQPEHLMRWASPWGEGFPGWHIECTVMSTKYLGDTFDIHGGGMDLIFPHHECEIAQAKAANKGKNPVKYWMHNNMLTVNGQKMSKSLGNFITLDELFSGKHPLLSQAYSPMVARLFILQAHYRSTIDFSDESLKATQKNYLKFINALKALKKMSYPEASTEIRDENLEKEISSEITKVFDALNDDLNTALALSHLLSLTKKINTFQNTPEKLKAISLEVFEKFKIDFITIFENILGIKEEQTQVFDILLESLLRNYQEAKLAKQYDKVDAIRNDLKKAGISLKDTKQGIDWAYTEE